MNKITCFALILIFLSGCDDTSSPQAKMVSIPDDVNYEIINQHSLPNIKRMLDIRLNKKVSKDVLTTIALTLKKSDPKRYKRTFIGYFLPGMEVNAGSWATSHFNPDLKVEIHGLTVEQEQALKKEPENVSRTVIGRWLDERPGVDNRTTIFVRDGKLYMENTYKDGSSGEAELLEKKSPLGRRFEKADGSGSDFGDHWILDASGNLQLRDNRGLISTAKKF